MNLEQDYEVTIDEEQRRDDGQVSFMERSEEDIEQLVESMHIVPSSRIEESVKGIGDAMNARDESENLDSLLRNTVRIHARAPIRSTINPDAHTIETESGRELQVTGEEYFLNQNSEDLGDFMDVSNVKWYKLEDNGVSTEETRNDREGEHIRNTADSEFGVEGFRVEVDGEPLDAEEVESFRRSISRRNQATVAPHNEVTELMMDYSSVEEAVENEDVSEQEFRQLYEHALSDGLVTEDGDFTLKGWLSAVDLRGPDLRGFEEVARGREELETTREGVFDSIANVREHDTTTTVEVNRIEWGGTYFHNFGIEELQQEEASRILSTFGEDFEELREEGELRVNAEVKDILQAVYGEELYSNEGLSLEKVSEISTDALESLKDSVSAPDHFSRLNFTAADLLDYSLKLEAEDQRQEEAFLELFEEEHGSYEEMKKEISEKMTINGLSLDYEGTQAPGILASRLGTNNLRFDDEGFSNNDRRMFGNPANLLLLPFQEELEEHDYDPTLPSSDLIANYGEVSDELRGRIEKLEEEGLLDTTVRVRESAEVNLQPETEEHYSMIDRAFSETSLDIPYKERQLSNARVEVDTVNVKKNTSKISALDEELDEYEEDILRLIEENSNSSNVFSYREFIRDYAADGSVKKAHEIIDKSEALQKVRKFLIGKPSKEIVEEEIGPYYHALEFTNPEHARVTEYFDDLDRPGSEELLEALKGLEDEGLVELKYGTDSTIHGAVDADTMVPDYEGSFAIDNYHKLNEEEKQRLYELEEEGVLELDKGRRELGINHSDELHFMKEYTAEATHIDTVFDEDEEETTYEDRIDFEHEEVTRYEANEQVGEIAEALDPMNFEKTPYEEITVENNFQYNPQAA